MIEAKELPLARADLPQDLREQMRGLLFLRCRVAKDEMDMQQPARLEFPRPNQEDGPIVQLTLDTTFDLGPQTPPVTSRGQIPRQRCP